MSRLIGQLDVKWEKLPEDYLLPDEPRELPFTGIWRVKTVIEDHFCILILAFGIVKEN